MTRTASATQAQDDADLVRRIAAGSPADEAELCRRYLDRVRLYGRRHLGNPQAVADLVQEVMAALIQAARAGRIEEPGRIGSFVVGVCRYMTWRIRRGEGRRGADTELDGLDLPAPEASRPAKLDTERLERCLAELPPRDQKILYLSFCEEQSALEIGSALALTEGNVRVLRHRALARLRAAVAGEAEET